MRMRCPHAARCDQKSGLKEQIGDGDRYHGPFKCTISRGETVANINVPLYSYRFLKYKFVMDFAHILL